MLSKENCACCNRRYDTIKPTSKGQRLYLIQVQNVAERLSEYSERVYNHDRKVLVENYSCHECLIYSQRPNSIPGRLQKTFNVQSIND